MPGLRRRTKLSAVSVVLLALLAALGVTSLASSSASAGGTVCAAGQVSGTFYPNRIGYVYTGDARIHVSVSETNNTAKASWVADKPTLTLAGVRIDSVNLQTLNPSTGAILSSARYVHVGSAMTWRQLIADTRVAAFGEIDVCGTPYAA